MDEAENNRGTEQRGEVKVMDASLKEAHRSCMVCGDPSYNKDTLNLFFESHEENRVTASFWVAPRYQGYNGLLHGGMASTLLDAAMTQCLFYAGIQALTAELTVRYIAPVKVEQEVIISAQLVSEKRGIYHLDASLKDGQQILVKAKAKFLRPRVGERWLQIKKTDSRDSGKRQYKQKIIVSKHSASRSLFPAD